MPKTCICSKAKYLKTSLKFSSISIWFEGTHSSWTEKYLGQNKEFEAPFEKNGFPKRNQNVSLNITAYDWCIRNGKRLRFQTGNRGNGTFYSQHPGLKTSDLLPEVWEILRSTDLLQHASTVRRIRSNCRILGHSKLISGYLATQLNLYLFLFAQSLCLSTRMCPLCVLTVEFSTGKQLINFEFNEVWKVTF